MEGIVSVKDVVLTRKITFLLYGESGLGKTSLLKSLNIEPKEILYIAADPGQLALQPKKLKLGEPKFLERDMTSVGYFQPRSFEDFKKIKDYIVSGEAKKKYKLLWIDGLDEVGEEALRLFMEREKAKGQKANLQVAYGDMATAMRNWIQDILRAPDISSVFTTHITENENSDIQYIPSFPGKKMTNSLVDIFDEVLCLRMERITPTSQPERLLQCTRNVGIRYQAKDRSGRLDDYEKPDLGAVINKIFGK